MKKTILSSVLITLMGLMVTLNSSCQKEEWLDNVSRSNVAAADPVHDTIPVHDTTIIYHTDTLRIDSIAEGVTRIILDIHKWTGDWQVIGWDATINATHQIQALVSENGNVFIEDSVIFTEVGTMSWTFQSTYTVSIDGPHNADENGCPDLQATCTRTWTYNVPAEYAEYFVGTCEQIPYLTQGNGNLVTVKTTNGHETKQAVFQVNVNIPGPQITDVTATCVHDNWGDWHVINGGIQIDGTNTVTETTHYDNGTSIVSGTDTYACHSAYMFNSRPTSYDHAIDGTYPVIGNTVADLGISMTHTHNHDNPIILNGHNYSSLAPDCDMEIYQVTVVGNNITLNGRGLVNGQYVYKDYTYSVTINIPTPTTDTTVFGNIVYWSLTGTANAYSWTAVQWYINIITNDADGYHHRAALYTEGMSVSQLVWHDYGVMTTAEYNHVVSVSNFNTTNSDGSNNAAQGIRRGLAVCKNSTAGANPGVSSTVKSDPNGGNNQVKYYSKTGSLIGACSAVTGTIDGNNGGEPVRAGGVENHFPMGSRNVY